MSTTKLVVIDTKTGVAKSFEGNFECGEAHLPDSNDEYTAAELAEQLDGFRLAADGARTRAQNESDEKDATGARITELSAEYAHWFDVFHPNAEPDTFGL